MRYFLNPIGIAFLIIVFVLTVGCSRNMELPPDGTGTFYQDEKGFPHGTGWVYIYYLDQTALKQKDAYIDGKLIYTVWYMPNGTKIAEQYWKDGTGIGLYLHEDGTIKQIMPYVNGIAEGVGTRYNPDGSVEKIEQYQKGQPPKKIK